MGEHREGMETWKTRNLGTVSLLCFSIEQAPGDISILTPHI